MKKIFIFQAEEGIRGLVRSSGLGEEYKRQSPTSTHQPRDELMYSNNAVSYNTSDAADDLTRL